VITFDLIVDPKDGVVRLTCIGNLLVKLPTETLLNHPEDFGRAVSAAVRVEIQRQGFASPYRNGGTL
jgi:hypothetical protein